MKNFLLFLLVFSVVTVSFADAELDVSSDATASPTDPVLMGRSFLVVGGHDALLSEAPTIYQSYSGGPAVVRNGVLLLRDDYSYAQFGFVSGATDVGATLNAGFSGTVALCDPLEAGLKAGMNLDVWSDSSVVAVPHAGLHIKSLGFNPTTLYATIAYGDARMPSSQTFIQTPCLYTFVGMKQRVGFLSLDVAVGNRNTVRLGLAVKEMRLFGSGTPFSLGVEFLRSSGRNSIAFFVTGGSF